MLELCVISLINLGVKEFSLLPEIRSDGHTDNALTLYTDLKIVIKLKQKSEKYIIKVLSLILCSTNA